MNIPLFYSIYLQKTMFIFLYMWIKQKEKTSTQKQNSFLRVYEAKAEHFSKFIIKFRKSKKLVLVLW